MSGVTKKYLLLLLFLVFPFLLFALSKVSSGTLKKFLKENDFYSRSNFEYLKKGKVLSNSESKSLDKKQQLWTKLAGFHSKSCASVLSKISRYEDYHKYIGFMKSSVYKDGVADLVIDVFLMPKPFKARVKIPRIDRPGSYPFTLSSGFIRDMQGIINVQELDERCFLFTRLDWKGPETKLSNFFMETFFNTVGKLGLNRLFAITGHRAE